MEENMKKMLNSNTFVLLFFLLALVAPPTISAGTVTAHRYASQLNKKDSERIAIKKWDAQALKEVSGAKTLSEILIALNFTRKGSAARELGEIRWEYLFGDALLGSKSFDETQSILHRERTKDERWNKIIVAREFLGNWVSTKIAVALYGTPNQRKQWDLNSLEEVKSSKTLQDIRRAFARAREGSPARKLAVRKASKFLPTK